MTFSPDRIAISNITQANPAVVTTSVNHGLTTGQVVRINVPQNYGMVELNKTANIITVLSANTFSLQKRLIQPFPINVDSTNFTAFTIPSNPQFTAEVLPIGAGPIPVTNTSAQAITNQTDDLLEDAVYNNSTTPIPF